MNIKPARLLCPPSPIHSFQIILVPLSLLLLACGTTPSPTPARPPVPTRPPDPSATPAPPTAASSPSEVRVVQAPKAPGVYGLVLEGTEGGSDLLYTIAIPEGYDPEQPVPLIIALHYGWNGPRPPQFYGGGLISGLVLPALSELKAIVVAPDCPGRDWANPQSEEAVLDLLSSLQAAYRIDESKVLLLGYSLGAEGTWYIAARNPGTFAAAIPISGRPHPEAVEQIEHTPLYVIHSRQDELFALTSVEEVVRELQGRRARVEFVVVEGLTHYEVNGFGEALRGAVPWIQELWKARAHCKVYRS